MKPYSMDLRRKVLAALDRGESARSVARRFEMHDETVRIFRDRREAGRLEPDKPGPKGPAKLTLADHAKLRELVAADPGLTLKQLADQMSVPVAESTIHRALKKLGLSFKKSRSSPPSRSETMSGASV
jgi:transposase